MTNETKKPIYKKWWFWLIAVLVFFTFIDLLIPDAEPEQNAVVETTEQTVDSEQPESVTKPEVATVDYTVFSEEDISYAGCKRVAIKIQVAGDAEQEAVDATLSKILESEQSEWEDITVWAYSDDIDPSRTAANKGMKESGDCN